MRRGLVVAGVGRVDEDALDAVEPLDMDEDAFRTFYDLTSSAVWAYLSHIDRRSPRGRRPPPGNLHPVPRREAPVGERRAPAQLPVPHRDQPGARPPPSRTGFAGPSRSTRRAGRPETRRPSAGFGYEERADLRRALDRLSPRERQMLWLAYAEGSSHQEIADTLGLRAGGIRVLLFRARRKLAALLTLPIAQSHPERSRGVSPRRGEGGTR